MNASLLLCSAFFKEPSNTGSKAVSSRTLDIGIESLFSLKTCQTTETGSCFRRQSFTAVQESHTAVSRPDPPTPTTTTPVYQTTDAITLSTVYVTITQILHYQTAHGYLHHLR